MKRTIVFLSWAVVLLLVLTGCARAARQAVEKPVEVAIQRDVVIERELAAAPAPAPAVSAKVVYSGAGEESVSERMIIRTGNLSLTVGDTAAALEEIKAIANGLGGFVVESNAWRENQQIRAQITVRVPAASFDVAMKQIKGLAKVVEREIISGQDVTEEYSDLDAQLRNLEATEKELRELLTQVRERTGKAEDIMAIYRELTNIRGQIERVKGRMQYLERMTAMATITVSLRPDIVAEPIAKTGWRPGATVAAALQRLVRALQLLADLFIQFVLFLLPVLVILALPLAALLLIIRWWRRRKKASK